jgi:hypothetical protein
VALKFIRKDAVYTNQGLKFLRKEDPELANMQKEMIHKKFIRIDQGLEITGTKKISGFSILEVCKFMLNILCLEV